MANFQPTSAEKKKYSFRQMNYSHFFHLSLVSKTGAFYAFIFLNRISVFFHFCIFVFFHLSAWRARLGWRRRTASRSSSPSSARRRRVSRLSININLKREILFGILLIVPFILLNTKCTLAGKSQQGPPALPMPPSSPRLNETMKVSPIYCHRR